MSDLGYYKQGDLFVTDDDDEYLEEVWRHLQVKRDKKALPDLFREALEKQHFYPDRQRRSLPADAYDPLAKVRATESDFEIDIDPEAGDLHATTNDMADASLDALFPTNLGWIASAFFFASTDARDAIEEISTHLRKDARQWLKFDDVAHVRRKVRTKALLAMAGLLGAAMARMSKLVIIAIVVHFVIEALR